MRIRLPKTCAVALLVLAGCGLPAAESEPLRPRAGGAQWRTEVEDASLRRTPTGTWTRKRIWTSRFDDFEARAISRIPGSKRILVTGMNDERGAILSTP
ncbi:hypothetical protein [Actinomadura sp. WMMA1423]|uniref:hypothetical protein n=1 Tax=Actinomadura sp. WMMA1423 TaxID=2591108 RepID=UPI0011464C15|nr:hypothetical protein [Actinomadura sp. WMMA1423]